ncbi:hypothetical protein [Corynebacterium cystitidis]|uniref:Secreted protein n=1 Tax=Corynebacterium cystitidis DSM 20524 TaxID=1121357 RepID=A0A1H9NZ46_9CORY|nr:hypothetical protein [Corynebacterium cystitidis]WJY82672.1 hypothetical protein CCYS_08790 [Corynebacterium cystitidis DSM 20524]SER41256.1 hypothetical protein SAMN05661109_00159 [Corynebacterium cystitidis DSM 20524]SNV72000.1 hypothetical membrane protein [Corynebacterium cystitidis]
MRNFRKAALVGATALAVAFGSTSVAAAQENPTSTIGDSNLSSRIGAALGTDPSNHGANNPAQGEPDNTTDGKALFGSSKGQAEGEETFKAQPAWAKLLYGGTIFAGVAGLVGLVFGPLYNLFVHGM